MTTDTRWEMAGVGSPDVDLTTKVVKGTCRKVIGVSSGTRKEDTKTWWCNEKVKECVKRKWLNKKKWSTDGMADRSTGGKDQHKGRMRDCMTAWTQRR